MSENRAAPHPVLRRYYRTEAERQAYLASSFDETAAHYDRINDWISFGTDRWYRRRALLRAGLRPGMRFADIGCGTGLVSQIARDVVGPEGWVVSVDPSAGMLGEAVARGRVAWPLRGKAEHLPLGDESVDFLCMAFALRHVVDLDVAFTEYLRVLKPGGRLLLLEMTPPRRGFLRALLKVHLRYVTPILTRIFTRSREATVLYKYCWDTLDQCVPPERVLEALARAGLGSPTRVVSARIFSEYTAERPRSSVA